MSTYNVTEWKKVRNTLLQKKIGYDSCFVYMIILDVEKYKLDGYY